MLLAAGGSAILRILTKYLFGLTCMFVFLAFSNEGQTKDFKVLYKFLGASDGGQSSELIADRNGNLYGATGGGGVNNLGSVFKLTQDGIKTILYSFVGGSDGWGPTSLLMDKAGYLYGTTSLGGGSGCSGYGCGTVFELAPDGTERILYAFQGGNDGQAPSGGLITDKQGNLYGVTFYGGGVGTGNCANLGCGTVFRLASDGSEAVVHAFTGRADGGFPQDRLLMYGHHLYGITTEGGGCTANIYGCGTVYKMALTGEETVLYAFTGGYDGYEPLGTLTVDSGGFLYGTTYTGGNGYGTVFRLSQDGVETVLAAFNGASTNPKSGVILVNDVIYGTTSEGGDGACPSRKVNYHYGCGSVFKLTSDGSETILHDFEGTHDGANPSTALVRLGGKLYGTTYFGGDTKDCRFGYYRGCGTIFAVKE